MTRDEQTPRERFNERVEFDVYPIDGSDLERLDVVFGSRIGQRTRSECRQRVKAEFWYLDPSDWLAIEAAYFNDPYPHQRIAELILKEIQSERRAWLRESLQAIRRRVFGGSSKTSNATPTHNGDAP